MILFRKLNEASKPISFRFLNEALRSGHRLLNKLVNP
jgi:hypothetical protein